MRASASSRERGAGAPVVAEAAGGVAPGISGELGMAGLTGNR